MDTVSAAIIVIGLIVIVALLNNLGRNVLSGPVTSWTDRQLAKRGKTYDRVIAACLAADDVQRAQEYRERLNAIRAEIARRSRSATKR